MSHEPDAPFDLSRVVVGRLRDGQARLVPSPPGPPPRIEGFTVGAPRMTQAAPRGVWHRVVPEQPSQLFRITPGPGGRHRPLSRK